ncbi:GNAT family N-acetyltransferase [Shewanella psychropiezotolerans]|uniref:GNAT family N-acetyltransferase n=1 Tax=Shewanella psychropiezotolerans TaxID=2593655 RepID=A0ABX5WVE3_9GAMM|nr:MULTISPECIES: GNAT family N-acetyltransferase [Shewanella]MPY22638.1 GNAT family N-acetyltransferase [Shewanella sp. YLB-07]QDO83066.1 GNAT family N-acetyltransferase [Shewanella psychropiezotolerans]
MTELKLLIRNMTADELVLALKWALAEGWNPGLNDAALFYRADPNGFFVGELEGEIVAVGSAVTYGKDFAFCGLYIVAPEHRGKGYGLALTKHRLAYCGERNVGIDGVLENVEIYQRIGYQPYYQNRRYQKLASYRSQSIEAITVLDNNVSSTELNTINLYDRQCFPANRETFLKAWMTQSDGLTLVYRSEGKISGYLVRRPCIEGYKVGPLFADNADIAGVLLNQAQSGIEGETLILDVPENNPAAVALAEREDMQVVFATVRMYQKGMPNIDNGKIFGITTFELG